MVDAGQSDDELLARISRGEEQAFVVLYRRHSPAVYRFAMMMTGSDASAADITQDVFLLFMQEQAGFDQERGSVAAYLCGIARNLALRQQRRFRGHVSLDELMEESAEHLPEPLVEASSALTAVLRSEDTRRVREAIMGLPVYYREALVLCDLQDMSYEQASAVLGCAIGTVRSRLHRARVALQGVFAAAAAGEAQRARNGSDSP